MIPLAAGAVLAVSLVAAPATSLTPMASGAAARSTREASLRMARVGPGTLRPVYMPEPGVTEVSVKRFDLDRVPVTNAEFAEFVETNSRWRRDRVPPVFADAGYLGHWARATSPGREVEPDAAVTRVSWFAAKAYCAAQGKRLPSENEWELAAAAGRRTSDGRSEPGFSEELLALETAPVTTARRRVGQSAPNYWGIQDLHGLVWEWVLDFNGTLVSGDSRDGKSAETLRFCGVGALASGDKEDYAGFLRAAFRSALDARYAGASLGFRCARDASGDGS